MRRLFEIVLPSAVGLCFVVWLAAVALNGQVAGTVNWWPYSWLWVLAIAAALMAGAFVALILDRERGPSRRRRSPDFSLTWRSPQMWELTRLQPTKAENVRQGSGLVTAMRMADLLANPLGDIEPHRSFMTSLPTDDGVPTFFTWRDGARIFYSKSVFAKGGDGTHEIVGIEFHDGDTIQT